MTASFECICAVVVGAIVVLVAVLCVMEMRR